MTATEAALASVIRREAYYGDADHIAAAVMEVIRNLKIPGLILWAQPEKTQ